ncbi:MAG: hypothetical protein D6795_06065 [Deltaproteobacteria bacterium]|nr:MAG: hypothetical protein D6795_06065 [Deltaproteobacteria bacterium]
MKHVWILVAAFLLFLDGNARGEVVEFLDESAFQAAVEDTLTVIDFDSIPTGNGGLQGDEFESEGLTITQLDDFPINVIQAPTSQTGSPPNSISASFLTNGYDNSRTDNFLFDFAVLSRAAGVYLGNIGPGPTELRFLDADGELIHSKIFEENLNFNNKQFFGILSDRPIKAIRTVEGCCDNDGLRYDDISFVVLPDTDGDLFPDELDNCPEVENPSQSDQDLDGIGDECDCAPTDANLPDENGDCGCGGIGAVVKAGKRGGDPALFLLLLLPLLFARSHLRRV